MSTSSLRNSILATIAYYDVFNFPLTFAEVYKYLINPKRLAPNRIFVSSEVKVEAFDIVAELDNMARAGMIGQKNGFYFMPGRDYLYDERIEKDKLAGIKWKKFLRAAKYLQAALHLKAVFASGSLAANNTEPKSDFDIFVVIKSGRLYTGRFFLWLVSSLLGVRRGRFDLVAPDKLCFNHYVTDDKLEPTHKSLYIAQSVLNMKPVIFSEKILGDFSSANKWVSGYCYNFRGVGGYRSIKPNKFILTFAKCAESLLNNLFGDFVESILKKFQQRRIKNNPATYESGGRIVFNDKELEFHPRSFEKVAIEKYNQYLKKLTILIVPEEDSGLM